MFDISPQCSEPMLRDRIHSLWDQLADIPAAEPEAALTLLLDELGQLIAGEQGFWFTLCRLSTHERSDPMLGWRPGPAFHQQECAVTRRGQRQLSRDVSEGRPGECLLNNIRTAGRFRASLIRERVSEAYLDSPQFHANLTDRGLSDSLAVISPVNEDTEVYVGFYRRIGQPAFSHQELDTVSYALRGLKWFQRQVLLTFGLQLAERPLTPTERRVMKQLLTGASEKQIAAQLGQRPQTTHNHVSSIYRKFNVNSRAELMALWI